MSKPIVLKVFRNGGIVDVKQFVDMDQIVIGSGDEAQLQLDGISPVHASIDKKNDHFFVSDLGSEKGTYHKGNKVLESELKTGDKIAVGDFIIEFYLGAPTQVAATTSAAVVDEADKEPMKEAETVVNESPAEVVTVGLEIDEDDLDDEPTQVIETSQVSAMSAGMGGLSTHGTYAPESEYKNFSEFVKPEKGSTVEVLVAWQERVLSSNHFKKGVVHYGSHPGNDVVIPSLSGPVQKAPLVDIGQQAKVFIPNGLNGTVVSEQGALPLSELFNHGRIQSEGGGSTVVLQQGEMVTLDIGGDLQLVVRYSSETPKPLLIPFVDFTSNGFLAVLLSIILAVVVSLYVALNKAEVEEEEEEQYRTALILENPLRPVYSVPLPKQDAPDISEKKIKPIKQKIKIKPDASKTKSLQVKKQKKKETSPKRKSVKRGGGNGKKAKSMRANPNAKKSAGRGSVKKGGAVKTGNKKGAQAKSETKDPSKSGIFGVFGSGGKQADLDNTYSGSGELAGLADQASGKSGWDENRAGDGLGSRFKETGGGKGKSNVGVSGISRGSGLGLGKGGSGTGLGGKGRVTIKTGGSGEEYGGNIDRNGIRQVFLRNQRVLQSCYEKALVSDKTLSGKVVLNFDIAERGRVTRATVSRGKSTLYNASLNSCVTSRLKTWRFPEPPDGVSVEIFYPLAFTNN